MGKRFTETEKWSDPWFRRLPSAMKLAWLYLLDNCDQAGVIDLDRELASFQIGSEVDWDEFASKSENRIVTLENGKIWIEKFVSYQYGELSKSCKAHNPAFKSIEKNGLNQRVSKGYPKGIQRDKDKEKVKVKKTVKVKEEYTEDFERFWKAFPSGRKQKKGDSFTAWKKAIQLADSETIIAAAVEYAESDKGRGEFVSGPTPWLNGRCWEDDREAWKDKNNKPTNGKPEKWDPFASPEAQARLKEMQDNPNPQSWYEE